MQHPLTLETYGDYHRQQLLADADNDRVVAQAKRALQHGAASGSTARAFLRAVAAAVKAVSAGGLQGGAMLLGRLEARSKTNAGVG